MMMNFRQSTLAAALCAAGFTLLSGHSAHADDDITFKGGGFGTLGAARTNSKVTQFRNEPTQWSGADNHIDLGLDSRLGVQGTVTYKSDFSITAQVLGIRREDEDFELDFEWLYAQYTGVPGLNLKAGRVALPAFLVSDSRRVGYAVPWMRVPPLAYSMLSLSTVDGVQAAYSHSFGPVVGTVQFTHGRGQSNLALYGQFPPGGGFHRQYIPVKQDNVNSLNGTLEWGDWSARIGQVTSEDSGTINVPTFFNVTSDIPSFKDKFTGVGLQYDNGKAVVTTEYLKRKTKPTNTSDASAWYVGGGYRFGEVMPYVLVSQYKPKTEEATKGTAIGVRYDFAKNVAFKAEFARYEQGGFVFLDSAPPVADAKVNVVSVALDFVF